VNENIFHIITVFLPPCFVAVTLCITGYTAVPAPRKTTKILVLITEYVSVHEYNTGVIKGGIKTEAGKNRLVPIHSKIAGFVHRRVSEGGEYLFTYKGKKVSTGQYYALWGEVMKQAGLSHTPHECRHTFRSRLDSLNANKVCIDRIMGHKSNDVGERIYTHKTIQELKNTIELITN